VSAKYLIDTNTAIFFFKGHPRVVQKWQSTSPSEVKLSAITLFELHVGSTTSNRPDERLSQIEMFLKYIEVLPIGSVEAAIAAGLVGIQRKTGFNIGPLDSLIASTAAHHGLVLVTNNTKHFSAVPGLVCHDWTL
jgi:tRNA(fMet)-specific endonuclease VapC